MRYRDVERQARRMTLNVWTAERDVLLEAEERVMAIMCVTKGNNIES